MTPVPPSEFGQSEEIDSRTVDDRERRTSAWRAKQQLPWHRCSQDARSRKQSQIPCRSGKPDCSTGCWGPLDSYSSYERIFVRCS